MSDCNLTRDAAATEPLLRELLQLSRQIEELAGSGHWAEAARCLGQRGTVFDRLREDVESGVRPITPGDVPLLEQLCAADKSALAALGRGRDALHRQLVDVGLHARTVSGYGARPPSGARFTDRRG